MGKLEKVGKFSIPAWSLPYLVNGDDSGISEEDKQAADDWQESLDHNCLTFSYPEDAGEFFTRFPEFGLPAMCLDVEVWGHRK